jgi:hypothetical protein
MRNTLTILIALTLFLIEPISVQAQHGHVSELHFKVDSALTHLNELNENEKRDLVPLLHQEKDSLYRRYKILSELAHENLSNSRYTQFDNYVTPSDYQNLTRATKVAHDNYFVSMAELNRLREANITEQKLNSLDTLEVRNTIQTIHKLNRTLKNQDKQWGSSHYEDIRPRHELELQIANWLLGNSEFQ